MPQETLEAFFANSKGEECVFTWRAIGGGLVTLLPAMTYTLRVNSQKPMLHDKPIPDRHHISFCCRWSCVEFGLACPSVYDSVLKAGQANTGLIACVYLPCCKQLHMAEHNADCKQLTLHMHVICHV